MSRPVRRSSKRLSTGECYDTFSTLPILLLYTLSLLSPSVLIFIYFLSALLLTLPSVTFRILFFVVVSITHFCSLAFVYIFMN